MCSSSKCDMPGLINGPVGNLVGMGIKALLNGAPIGPRSAEALRQPTDKENIKQFYDNVEAHLKGALQILQPALEIKKILGGECKSAGPERSAVNSATPIVYYSPQNPPKSQTSVCPSRRGGLKKSSNRTTDKSSFAQASNARGDKSTAEITAQTISSSSSNKCKKSAAKKCSPCFAGETSGNSSCSRYESKGKALKASAKTSKSKQAQCCICNVSLKENIALAMLPCEHSFCYTCLAKAKVTRCQKCDKSFDMKNVSQIFVTTRT